MCCREAAWKYSAVWTISISKPVYPISIKAADLPLCLLTSDMQNRRILDGAFRNAGVSPAPEIETNSILNLFTNVQRGRLATILPDHFLDVLGEHRNVKALRLVNPVVSHKIGLLIADRDPASPVAESLWKLATELDVSQIG